MLIRGDSSRTWGKGGKTPKPEMKENMPKTELPEFNEGTIRFKGFQGKGDLKHQGGREGRMRGSERDRIKNNLHCVKPGGQRKTKLSARGC